MPQLGEIISLASVDAAQFKAAMRCVASTVSVITSGSGTAANGMTATAVCSVSASPPCILVVVNQSNRSHALIERSGVFAVNVLSEGQTSLAEHFASKSDTPLKNVPHDDGVTGVPILGDCVANLECVVQSQTISGTHSIFVGRVVSTHETTDHPLLYWCGRFSGLTNGSSSR